MVITHFEAVMGGLGTVVTILCVVITALRWIYSQGASSQKLVSAVEANTEATSRLTAAYDKFSAKTDSILTDHEKRITRLEDAKPHR